MSKYVDVILLGILSWIYVLAQTLLFHLDKDISFTRDILSWIRLLEEFVDTITTVTTQLISY